MADSLTLRQFLAIGLDERTPDHVTISRTRRLIDAATHQLIFSWVLERMAEELTRYLRGWIGYFGKCETPSVLERLE